MKGIAFVSGLISALLTFGTLPAPAQVLSDNTTNTTVNLNGNNFNILNGIQKGNNLFHSFKEFSIPSGGEAIFKNSNNIVNIINRVTGGNISNIDGLIKANGNANLFLINPAGIVFGENASLDISGSFLGSTAESILFEDGFEFSAVNAQSAPLLTLSVPLGLQMGSNSGSITVQGNGHAITGGAFFPLNLNDTATGLKVSQGETLGLIGNAINLIGGIIRVPGGNIQLSSIEEGRLKLDNSSPSWQFDTSQVQKFANINLLEKSLVDTSGIITGDIQLQARNITLKDASAVIIQNNGTQPSGNITLNATDTILIADEFRNAPDRVTPFGTITGIAFSRLTTETLGTGKAGDIFISSGNLFLKDVGLVLTRTYSTGDTGSIDVNIGELIEIDGFSSFIQDVASSIAVANFGNGDAKEINISAQNFNVLNGALLTSSNFSSAQGGDIQINVSESLTMSGFSQTDTSLISSLALRTGNSGNVTINTSKLEIFDFANIGTSTWAEGSAGKLTINASESINISGVGSAIDSSAPVLNEIFRQTLGLPDLPSGDSGSIVVNTPGLTVTDSGVVSVDNQGLGNSGNIEINTDQIFLDNKGNINAFSASGKGGSVRLNIQDSLLLRNTSSINTEAKSTGNGGNITINSPVIAGFENSDIIANAVEGNGGNINITTQGIFGLEFRNELTEGSDITASSQLGVNGTVEINNISIDPSSGLTELPVKLADSSQQIAAGCSSNTGSTFVATGKGGVPHNPNQSLYLNRIWSDIRNLSQYRQRNSNSEVTTISNKLTIVEATGFMRNNKGEIELVALRNTPLRTKQLSECSGANHNL
ncbi:filamentous hemagglutinin family N-terminal domain protein [Rivularia sp. PCC 7116]|uniref:two-partner secretion domain-containing protein n=1 Tax=Rivularia sp. PCC 7116 TaxID=373994 RepID=UPI00029F2638|nr:filamentous hemagglutinin N-terminal domain-containing protein [Rivularia sp. PCC 7116]AFY53461.1 filamentous hemagglutinin family N-terminal domain protein [Rivularia sp. PCC 7116]